MQIQKYRDTKIDSRAFTLRYAHSLIEFSLFKVIRPIIIAQLSLTTRFPEEVHFSKFSLNGCFTIVACTSYRSYSSPCRIKMIRNNISYSAKQSFKNCYNGGLHGYFDPNIILNGIKIWRGRFYWFVDIECWLCYRSRNSSLGF